MYEHVHSQRKALKVYRAFINIRPFYSLFVCCTVSVLCAMALFQTSWTAYMVLHLAFDSEDFDGYYEVEFCLAILYTAISPYVYGIGNNLFSLKNKRSN